MTLPGSGSMPSRTPAAATAGSSRLQAGPQMPCQAAGSIVAGSRRQMLVRVAGPGAQGDRGGPELGGPADERDRRLGLGLADRRIGMDHVVGGGQAPDADAPGVEGAAGSGRSPVARAQSGAGRVGSPTADRLSWTRPNRAADHGRGRLARAGPGERPGEDPQARRPGPAPPARSRGDFRAGLGRARR